MKTVFHKNLERELSSQQMHATNTFYTTEMVVNKFLDNHIGVVDLSLAMPSRACEIENYFVESKMFRIPIQVEFGPARPTHQETTDEWDFLLDNQIALAAADIQQIVRHNERNGLRTCFYQPLLSTGFIINTSSYDPIISLGTCFGTIPL